MPMNEAARAGKRMEMSATWDMFRLLEQQGGYGSVPSPAFHMTEAALRALYHQQRFDNRGRTPPLYHRKQNMR